MTSAEIRQSFLNFFKKKGHPEIGTRSHFEAGPVVKKSHYGAGRITSFYPA